MSVVCPHCQKPFRMTVSVKDRGSLERHLLTVKANETIYKNARSLKYRLAHPDAPMVKKYINDHNLKR